MGSERLPGKIIAPLGGRPLLAQLWARVGPARVDEWWLATSSDPTDDVTEAWGFELGLRVFRGDRTDVLSRFLAMGSEANAEGILRVTADNPFLDAKLIDALLDARDASEASKNADAIRLCGELPVTGRAEEATESCATTPTLPHGYGVELVRLSALERADKEIPEEGPCHRTHLTSWFAREGPRSREDLRDSNPFIVAESSRMAMDHRYLRRPRDGTQCLSGFRTRGRDDRLSGDGCASRRTSRDRRDERTYRLEDAGGRLMQSRAIVEEGGRRW